jgi:hypothetical protein
MGAFNARFDLRRPHRGFRHLERHVDHGNTPRTAGPQPRDVLRLALY